MPAHVLFGDGFLVSRALKELQGLVGSPDVLEANSHRIAGAQADLGQLTAVCGAVPFLAEHRLVTVEGLLSLYEPAGGRRRGQGQEGRGNQRSMAEWDGLAGYVAQAMPPTTLLVFVDGRLSRGNPLLQQLWSEAEVKELSTPSGEVLARWVKEQVEAKGSRITPGAIRVLTQMVGGDLWTLDNEMEKLATFAVDRAIEEADVRLLVPEAREANIFAAVDALLDGKSAVALRAMHRLRDGGTEFPYIASMVARQLRLVTLARDLMDRGHGQKEIGERLGITYEFALKRTVGQARSHSWASLEWLYGKLLEADLAVKQGRTSQDVAVELLVSQVAGPTVRRSRQ